MTLRKRWRPQWIVAALLIASACTANRPPADLAARARSAQTPAERTAAADAYRQEAERLRAEAARHDKLAQSWATLAGGKSSATGSGRYEEARHCAQFARYLREAAGEAEALGAGLDEKEEVK